MKPNTNNSNELVTKIQEDSNPNSESMYDPDPRSWIGTQLDLKFGTLKSNPRSAMTKH